MSLINGTPGNDTLDGGAGDTLVGGDGQDTVVYTGLETSYTVTELPEFRTAQVTGPGGTDTLQGIETLRFADATVQVAYSGVGPAEFRANTTTSNDQSSPSVTALADGGWVVTWQSYGQDGSGSGIYGQRYTSAGVASGGEFRANTTTSSEQTAPSITALADGGWVVSWQSSGQDGSGSGVYGQRYTAAGVASGVEFRANTTTYSDQSEPSVTALADGGWVVTWHSNGQDGSDYGIYGQRYTVAGAASGGEFRVNTTASDNQLSPSVTALTDGGWVVTWTSYGQDGSSWGIYGQRYNVAGVASGVEFQANTFTSSDQYSPSVTALADGGWVVTWQSYNQDDSSWGIYGQCYTVAGATNGVEFRANTTTSNDQSSPAVTALADGGWVVTWMSYGQDGSGSGIYGQRYTVDGAASGSEFRANTTTYSAQGAPSVTALTDGGWVVTWMSSGQDGSSWGIYGQRYNATGEPVGTLTLNVTGDASSQLLTGSTGGDTVSGLAGDDTLDGGAGADTLIGGTGNDVYLVDHSGDVVTELPGEGTDEVRSSAASYTLPANIERLTLSGTVGLSGTGNAQDNLLTGNSSDDTLDGGAGNDTLVGGTGADVYLVDSPSDVVTELSSQGIDEVRSSAASYTLPANVERLTLSGTASLSGTGNALDNLLTGNSGNDTLDGGVGNDTLVGGDGQDTVVYTGLETSYTVTELPEFRTAQVTGPGGTDTLQGIETLRFADATVQVAYSGVGPAEFRANTTTSNDQSSPSVTALADGGWVVTWQSYGQDGSGSGIYGQRYTAAGSVSGTEFQVNTFTNGEQSSPAVTALADGGWVVTWESYGQDRSGFGIYCQRYTVTGAISGVEFRANTTTSSDQSSPSVTALTDGGWVVTWTSSGQDGSGYGIYGQRYTVTGATSGVEFRANTTTSSDQYYPAVTALTDGGWVVTWMSSGQDGSGLSIYGQRYTVAGATSGVEFQVNTFTSSDQSSPAVTALTDGGWVVTWMSYGQDGSGYGIYGQRYTVAGAASGVEFRVNTTTSNDQTAPSVTALADGGWVVTWTGYGGSAYGICSQRYDAAGAASGVEFLANTTINYGQGAPSVTALTDGGWVVTWQSSGQDGSAYGIYGQRYNATGEPVGDLTLNVTGDASSQLLTGSTGGDTVSGLAGDDTLDGGAGADTLIGGTGNDVYLVDHSGDVVTELAGEGTDEVRSSAASYTLPVNVERLTLSGTVGLSGTGNALDNVLTGNSGNDTLDGGTGNDTLVGGIGADVYLVDSPSDVVTELSSQGIDEVRSSAASYTLPANVERLTLSGTADVGGTGNAQDNLLTGNSGDNTLDGGAGNDTLVGGAGADTLVGGAGDDFLIGGDGQNVALYSGVQAGYTITWSPMGVLVHVPGVEGTDELLGIETVRFADATVQVAYGGVGPAEFRANTTTYSDQTAPSIAALDDGGWVVTWMSSGQDGSGLGIYGQRYTSAGAASGSEFRVNTFTSSDQFYPSVTALSDGGWVVAWMSSGQDGSGLGIYGQRYTVAGAASSGEFRANTTTSDSQYYSAVTALSDGGWVVTWMSSGQDGSGSGIYGQRYNVAGVASGVEFQVNTTTSSDQSDPSVTALADGGWVVTWMSSGQDDSGNGIYGQRYTAAGVVSGSEFQVNTFTSSDQYYPAVTALTDGGWVVTWMSYGQDGSGSGIYGQRYTVAGVASGVEFRVNTTTSNDQTSPSVTALADGGWVVAWAGYGGSGYGIYGQRYDAAGAASGVEFLANTFSNYGGSSPSVTVLTDGGWVVTWMSSGQDGSSWGIYGQRYNATGEPVGALTLNVTGDASSQLLTGSTGGDTVSGLAGDDTLDGGTGADTLIGGTGNDVYLVEHSRDVVTELAGEGTDEVRSSAASYTLPANIERLTLSGAVGLSGTGNALDNVLTGNSGDDTLDGGAGADTLVGGTGNDVYLVDHSGDVVTELAGEGTDEVRSSVSYVLGANLENLTLTGTSALDGTGNTLNNVLTGNSGDNTLDGGAGDDLLIGGDGQDVALYSGVQAAYTITQSPMGVLVHAPGVEGTDELLGIETVRFADATVQVAYGVGPAEFRANTTTYSDQTAPSIAALDDGGWVVTWKSSNQDGSGYGIYGQRYTADGVVSGGEFRANTTTSSDQTAPSVTALTDGGWVVTWEGNGGSGWGIYGQRYTAVGVTSGSELRANTTGGSPYSPSVTALTDGGWVVTWKSYGQDGSRDIYGQRYTVAGANSGVEFQVNTTTSNDQSSPAVTALSDGGWVVTWQSVGQDGSGDGIYGQRYTAAGATSGVEFQVNTFTSNDQSSPAVTALTDGGWVVTWQSAGQDGWGSGIYAQRYTVAGAASGVEFRVNTTTSGDQYSPSVTALADGGWVVAWAGTGGSGYGICSQHYDAAGAASGVEFLANTTTSGGQSSPSVTALSDGGWVVAWQSSYQQDGSGYGIYGQRYNATGEPVGALTLNITGDASSQLLIGATGDDTVSGLAGDDTLDGGAGADTLIGGTGNDVYLVDHSGDVVTELAGEGTDEVRSSISYVLGANLENLMLMGGDALDGTGNALDNVLQGNDADNWLDGAAGADTLVGGAGDDTLDGGEGADSLVGGAGNDTLDGGTGADTLVGGTGNDVYLVDHSGDVVTELAGEGTDEVRSSISYVLGANLENLTLTGTAALEGTGNTLDNLLTGNSGDDTLDGGAGNDTLVGGAGADTLVGGAGDDLLIGGDGQDVALYSGVQAAYAITQSPMGGVLVRALGVEGTDDLRDIETVRFADATVQVAYGVGPAEFRANTFISDFQSSPSVTTLADGGWVVTWLSSGQDGSGYGIYGQRYTVAGVASGGEFRTNTFTSSDQYSPAVTALADGGWVVTWMSSGQDGSGYGIYGQRYNVAGATSGSEFRVNTTTSSDQYSPSVTALTDGGWVVTWQSYEQDGSGSGIYGQRYTVAGAASGVEFLANTTINYAQGASSVTALTDGGWVVTWTSSGQDGSGYGIYGQRYTVAGVASGGEFRANTFTSSDQYSPAVTALADGGWVVTWESYNQDGSGYGIYGQRYTAAGVASGGEFRANTTISDNQLSPSVTALADGGWVVTWESYNQDGSGYGIYGQRYTAAGVASGGEFRANTTISDNQLSPSVTALTDGGWVVTWTSYGQDGSYSSGIYSQRYNATGEPVGVLTLNVTGDASSQFLTGATGGDTVSGLAGDDTLDGGAGADTLIGGTGNDVYLVDHNGDVVTELAGEGTDEVRSSISYVLGANLENLTRAVPPLMAQATRWTTCCRAMTQTTGWTVRRAPTRWSVALAMTRWTVAKVPTVWRVVQAMTCTWWTMWVAPSPNWPAKARTRCAAAFRMCSVPISKT